MADIIYNGAKVIEYARSRKGQSEATAVTWGCSPEFDATRSTEVSFVEDGAFVAIPRPIPRSGSRYIPKVSLSVVMYMLLFTIAAHICEIVVNVIKLSRRNLYQLFHLDNVYSDIRGCDICISLTYYIKAVVLFNYYIFYHLTLNLFDNDAT